MGCLCSKSGQVRTLSDDLEEPLPASAYSTRGVAQAWLQEIGLPQYAEAFENAGFSDWDLLSCLNESDLDAITTHTGTRIPPGHRKKLLMASRQMGTTATQTALGFAPPCGSARRYSHTSNPGNGNGSRGGGLAAAAAAVMSLERRSNGRRPSSTSRVPSLANGHPGLHPPVLGQHPPVLGQHPPGPGHPLHLLLLSGTPSRHATEDGLISGRRSRAVGAVMTAPSRNSSRNSLSAGGAGHAIGYIASPSMTAGQEAGGSDPWVTADGRRSPAEPGSPTAGGGPTPPRARRRWSAHKCASRGVLIGGSGVGGGGGAGNVPASASSYGWLEPEVAASVLGAAAGPITDDVRQMSMTSSVGDALIVGVVPAVQPCTSRDLEALVMGANGGANGGAQPSRCQSLAARRDRSNGGGGSGSGLPSSSPPPRQSGGQSGAAPSVVGGLPYVRGSMRQAAAAAAAQPQFPAGHSPSQPSPDGTDLQQNPLQQPPRVSSARDGAANSPVSVAAAGGGSGAAAWGMGAHGSPSLRRPGSAADSAVKFGASPQQPPRAPTGAAAAVAAASAIPPPPQPGVAWAVQGEANVGANSASTAATAARPYDDDARGAGGPGGALPRFVRAIAGWAIPTPAGGGGGAAAAGTKPNGGSVAAGVRHARPANRQRRTYQRQSAPHPGRQQSRSGSSGKEAAGEVSEQAPAADRVVAGDVFAVGAAAGTAACTAAAAVEPTLHREDRSGRSQRQLLAPDVLTPRGVWDQEYALCIQGRGYKPPPPGAAGTSIRRAAAAGAAAAAGDCDAAPSSTSRPASGHAAAPAGSFLAAAAAAARGGGWPFVMPQLPLPARTPHADSPGPPQPPLEAPAVLAVRCPSGAVPQRCGAPSGSFGMAAPAALGKMAAAPDSMQSMMLESLANAATAAWRAPPVHSSRPGDWYPSVGGAPEATAAAAKHSGTNNPLKSDADGESSADELALHGSSSVPRSHRVQIVSSAMAMAAPYKAGGGAAAAEQSPRVAAAEQWPVMPMQPPTRAKPTAPPALGYGGGGAANVSGGVTRSSAVPGGNGLARMEVLARETPGPSRASAAPPGGGGAAGGLPRPTPGRKLDLEMLAEQVGRVMSHLTHMTTEEEEAADGLCAEDMASAAVADVRVNGCGRNAGGDGAEGGGGGGGDAELTTAAGVSSLRLGTRSQAIDQKRLELQHLHKDLVRRVAAMASDPSPHAAVPAGGVAASYTSGAATAAAAGGGCGGGGVEPSAADALAEVEVRIRTKLKELAALTMRPDPDRRTGDDSNAAAAGGSSSSGAARKRTLDPDTMAAMAAGWDETEYDSAGGGGQRRARDEAVLHQEVLAVLGARKRQVRGASTAAAVAGPSRRSGSGSEDGAQGQAQLRRQQQQQQQGQQQRGQQQRGQLLRPPPRQGPAQLGAVVAAAAAGADGGALLREHSPASAALARGAGGGGGDVLRGGVLAEMHDSLRAELLAIDSKIKARVLGSGGAVSRRA